MLSYAYTVCPPSPPAPPQDSLCSPRQFPFYFQVLHAHRTLHNYINSKKLQTRERKHTVSVFMPLSLAWLCEVRGAAGVLGEAVLADSTTHLGPPGSWVLVLPVPASFSGSICSFIISSLFGICSVCLSFSGLSCNELNHICRGQLEHDRHSGMGGACTLPVLMNNQALSGRWS